MEPLSKAYDLTAGTRSIQDGFCVPFHHMLCAAPSTTRLADLQTHRTTQGKMAPQHAADFAADLNLTGPFLPRPPELYAIKTIPSF